MVIARSIPQREREAIEAAGLSWCDGRGALHLEMAGALVHIDHHAVAAPPARAAGGLGPVGIRAVQVLIENPAEEWTVTGLAERARISAGGAHNVLRALQREQLAATTGKGPQQRRTIPDSRALLDWLAAIDARNRPDTAAGYLYARTASDLVNRFATLARDAHLTYAVTAGAAAHALRVPVLSRISVVQVRVSGITASDALHTVGLEHLDQDTPGQGANIEMWTDTGDVGTFAASEIDQVWVAPRVRVYLDLVRQGGRNVDAAGAFREQTLDQA
jgi:hypothetical protein